MPIWIPAGVGVGVGSGGVGVAVGSSRVGVTTGSAVEPESLVGVNVAAVAVDVGAGSFGALSTQPTILDIKNKVTTMPPKILATPLVFFLLNTFSQRIAKL
jgi:hypothetical protein